MFDTLSIVIWMNNSLVKFHWLFILCVYVSNWPCWLFVITLCLAWSAYVNIFITSNSFTKGTFLLNLLSFVPFVWEHKMILPGQMATNMARMFRWRPHYNFDFLSNLKFRTKNDNFLTELYRVYISLSIGNPR